MNFLKIFTFVLMLSLTVGLIACSDDTKDETQTDENQPEENVQNTPPNNNQQGSQGNQQQQQMQKQQQQMQQQMQADTDTSGTKAEVKAFLKKMVIWVKSDEYINQLRKTIQPGQDQQQSMAERKKMDKMFFDLLKNSGFPNNQSFEFSMKKYQMDEDVKQELDKLRATIESKMKIIQGEMMKQQLDNQQNQKPNVDIK